MTGHDANVSVAAIAVQQLATAGNATSVSARVASRASGGAELSVTSAAG